MRHAPIISASALLALLAFPGCGGGGGGGGGPLAKAIGVATADYVVLDLATGAITTRTSIADLATASTWRTTRMVFKAVQPGSSSTGSQIGDFGHQSDEVAATATLPKYYVGVFEVTQAQWQLLDAAAAPWIAAPQTAAGGGAGAIDPEKPAFALTFARIQAAVAAWNGAHAIHLAIPSEGQWEHACRGGAATDFAWGNQRDEATVGRYALLFETLNGATGPAKVGSLAANGYGLYDVHGNVWEWTQVTASTGRVRGGSWNDTLAESRCANKVDLDALTVHALVGARLVLVP